MPDSNRLIIKLNPSGSNDTIGIMAELSADVIHHLDSIGAEVWEVADGTAADIVAEYQDDPRIAFIEQDTVITLGNPEVEIIGSDAPSPLVAGNRLVGGQIVGGQIVGGQIVGGQNSVTNDTYYSYQWAIHNTGQTDGTLDADIDGPETWQVFTGTQVLVGVIDSGVDYNHEDLVDNMWINPNEIPGNNIDDDNNGYIDDIHGWDFFDSDNDPMDDNGHGTHVAGTIAAAGNNAKGVVGVSWNAQIMALRFIGSEGWGYLSDAIAAIEYATMMEAKLTNNSWGGGGYYQAMYDAIAAADQAGVLFIAAAGNETSDNDTTGSYPSSYELDNVISVASTTHDDELSSFSNYGHTSVALGAPGSTIVSTYPGGYAYLSGTSMASPHVAGAAALLWSAYPHESAADIKARILNTVDPVPALDGKTVTGGRLNLHQAYSYQLPLPLMELSTTALNFDLYASDVVTTSISITNSGDATLSWEASIGYQLDGVSAASETAWLTLTPTSGNIISGTAAVVDLSIDTAALADGLHVATVTFASNDPTAPLSTVTISTVVETLLYPSLAIPAVTETTYWPDGIEPFPGATQESANQIDVPIHFNSNDFSVASVVFSLDFDESCLSFDDVDANEDGIPDNITMATPEWFFASILYNPQDTDGELDFVIADIASPVTALPDGILATISFDLGCKPEIAEPELFLIDFSADPMASFGGLGGESIPGTTSSGQISVRLGLWHGDCNGDLTFDVADISAVILELFDGDGDHWLSADGGTFTGSVAGCDANQDEQIDAGDLICTVLILFDGVDACLVDESLAQGQAEEAGMAEVSADKALLTIGKPVVDDSSQSAAFTLSLEDSHELAAALTFSLAFDPALFRFDSADVDLDGLPDGVTTTLGAEHVITVVYHEVESRIDIMIADLTPSFNRRPALTPLPDGELLTLPFYVQDTAIHSTETDSTETITQTVARHFATDSAPFGFAADFEPSMGTISGQSGPLQAENRAVTTQTQTAVLPPMPGQPEGPTLPEDESSLSDNETIDTSDGRDNSIDEERDEGTDVGADERADDNSQNSENGMYDMKLFMPLINR